MSVLAYGQSSLTNKTNNITYPIVDTGVGTRYSDKNIIGAGKTGDVYYGQDADYSGNQPAYTDNGDGTVTDEVTGLMWEVNMGEKMTFANAFDKAADSKLGGHTDWRVPTIKELYSLILFSGRVEGAMELQQKHGQIS